MSLRSGLIRRAMWWLRLFEGSQVEQEAIERAVEDAGYEVSRLSERTAFTEGPDFGYVKVLR